MKLQTISLSHQLSSLLVALHFRSILILKSAWQAHFLRRQEYWPMILLMGQLLSRSGSNGKLVSDNGVLWIWISDWGATGTPTWMQYLFSSKGTVYSERLDLFWEGHTGRISNWLHVLGMERFNDFWYNIRSSVLVVSTYSAAKASKFHFLAERIWSWQALTCLRTRRAD